MSQEVKYMCHLHKAHMKDSIEDAANQAIKQGYGYDNKEIEIYEVKLVKKVKIVTGFEEVDIKPSVVKSKKKK